MKLLSNIKPKKLYDLSDFKGILMDQTLEFIARFFNPNGLIKINTYFNEPDYFIPNTLLNSDLSHTVVKLNEIQIRQDIKLLKEIVGDNFIII